MKINYKNIKTYQKNGDIYTQMPVYEGRKNTGNTAFMRLLGWRNGLSLFCHEDPNLSHDDCKRYFVFKDDNTLWLEVTSKNAENINLFFNK